MVVSLVPTLSVLPAICCKYLVSSCVTCGVVTYVALCAGSLFESVRQQQQQQQEQQQQQQERAPLRSWGARRRPGPGTDWTLLTEPEHEDEVVGRQARSTSWLTSNTTARSVLPPGYDMLEKPRSPVPGQCATRRHGHGDGERIIRPRPERPGAVIQT